MPELSRFLGIVIAMFYRDAPPHFHAIYGEHEATINIDTGEVNGHLPKRAMTHVQEWRLLHQEELRKAWSLAISQQPLPKIEPLE